jgi:hypothetical protein
MNKFYSGKLLKSLLFFFVLIFSATLVSAQTPNVAQIEEPITGIEILLFLSLLLFMLLAPAFKKREWPKLRKGYDYFVDKGF